MRLRPSSGSITSASASRTLASVSFSATATPFPGRVLPRAGLFLLESLHIILRGDAAVEMRSCTLATRGMGQLRTPRRAAILRQG